MRYISTRDPLKKSHTFEEILLEGLAPDGGLYCPEVYPKISKEQLDVWGTLSYQELAYEIMNLYMSESIPKETLKSVLEKTYTTEKFTTKEIVPVKKIDTEIYVQDLSLGPSLAFKDIAMQFLGNLMSEVLEKRGESITIVGASSGDTVSAAEEAFKGKKNINVIMLTPKEGMSPFQKAQAGSILEENIFNISIKGPFDTCQDLVKALNAELEFKREYHIAAVNSINWGRIIAQVVYYFKAYFELKKEGHVQFDVVVPSGNFGNVLAGYVSKQMGLPIRKLYVSTNENKVLDQFFKTGLYKQEEVQVTSTPSMDISKASNIERLFFDILNRDATLLSQKMTEFETKKEINLKEYLKKLNGELGFESEQSTHEERQAIIKWVYQNTGLVIDPHTAAAVKVAKALPKDSVPKICMETAKPAKFESTVEDALGFVPERPSAYIGLEEKPQRFFDSDATVEALKSFIQTHIKR